MTNLLYYLPGFLIMAMANIAIAQSEIAQPSYDAGIEKDHIICQRNVDGVTFFYGLIDDQWQAVEASAENRPEILDCDEYYLAPDSPVS